MMYDTLLSRSFSKHEQKKLKYGGFITCFLIALSFCTIFKPYSGPLPALNLQLSVGAGLKLKIVNVTDNSQKIVKAAEFIANNKPISNDIGNPEHVVSGDFFLDATNESKKDGTTNGTSCMPQHIIDRGSGRNKIGPVCNMLKRSDFCEINGDIRIDTNSPTVFIILTESEFLEAAANTSWNIRPYARKGDVVAMSHTKEWQVKLVSHDHSRIPKCTQNHNAPAILFSLGGYSGNHFHAFTDIIVPLYLTARPLNRNVQFLVTDNQPRWIAKFKIILNALSTYDVIDIDKSENVPCFRSITVGLKRQSSKELSIDPLKSSGYSMKDFRQLLRSRYSLSKTKAIKTMNDAKKPRLLIISRKRSRAFTNAGELAKMAKRLGYEVVVDEPDANVSRSAKVINSCDVALGVHGAGLTNMVFLPENAILIQVVPFGGAEWVSKTFFEEPSKDMNIRYLEYKISLQESSLINQYPSDHIVLRNPSEIKKQGWEVFKSTYFDSQNISIDLNTFRPTLLKALELLQQ